MKLLLNLSTIVLILVPAFASAWQENTTPSYGYDSRQSSGNFGAPGDSSGDWQTDLQFDVQMQGSGDTDAYIYGTLGNGWDNVQIHRYDNGAMRSDHMRDHRPAYRENQWPHSPAYQQPHHEQYPQPHPDRYSGRYSGQYREPYSAPRR